MSCTAATHGNRLLPALLLAPWVYKGQRAPESRDAISVVAAVQDMPLGKRLQAGDLKVVSVDRKNLPKGYFMKPAISWTDRCP